MKRALLILSPGFEEMEAVAPLDLLRRAGIETVAASAGPALEVEGGRGIKLKADCMLADCPRAKFDLLILPGGPGVDGMRQNPAVLELVRQFHAEGKPIAAICAAPLVLADAGVLTGRTVTSFPGSRAGLEGRIGSYSEDRIVSDGNIITSRGAGTAEEFALALVELLAGTDAAEDVRMRIVARPRQSPRPG